MTIMDSLYARYLKQFTVHKMIKQRDGGHAEKMDPPPIMNRL